jgi:ornithine cyclodeaminase/alanine dehydrogenase-like protein (mu-crystallin family)
MAQRQSRRETRITMTLFINNDVVSQVLTIEDTISALEQSYRGIATGEAVCRPRIDIRIPTSDASRRYQFGSMEGGSTAGYFAVRMKSDIVYQTEYEGVTTQEKYCTRPGLYCGLVFLTSIENGEPLAFINDGVLQHMRVGGDGGIGVKYMANEDAEVIGMLGSGGMARTHVQAFTAVRNIRKLQVFSPTREHREQFAAEMRELHGIEVQVCENPEGVYKGAHIVAAVTDSAVPVMDGACLEKGQHIVNIGGGGSPDKTSLDRVDVYFRFGNAPAPVGRPDLALDDEYLGWEARGGSGAQGPRKRGHGVKLPDRLVTFADLVTATKPGRTSPDQITYSERGNLQGAQFFAIAGRIYELARERGLGNEVPTEWFLQDIRD